MKSLRQLAFSCWPKISVISPPKGPQNLRDPHPFASLSDIQVGLLENCETTVSKSVSGPFKPKSVDCTQPGARHREPVRSQRRAPAPSTGGFCPSFPRDGVTPPSTCGFRGSQLLWEDFICLPNPDSEVLPLRPLQHLRQTLQFSSVQLLSCV